MTHAIAKSTSKGRRYLMPAVIVLAVAALIGAAFSSRRPDLGLMPQSAASPVILADRSAIYVQKYEVTVAEWNKCNAAGRCSKGA